MSPIQYRTHSKAIQYLILSKFWGRFRHDAPLSFYSFLSPDFRKGRKNKSKRRNVKTKSMAIRRA